MIVWGLPLHVPAVVDLLVRALQVAKALHGVHRLPELEDLLDAAVAEAAGLGAERPVAAEADERGCDTAGTSSVSSQGSPLLRDGSCLADLIKT